MTALDLTDLCIFDEMLKTRNVSRAAEAVGLGQPAISMRLARLRRHFGDPLFVRTTAGMEPTPRALALAAPVQQALGILRHGMTQGTAFDPATSTRTFTLLMSDIGAGAFLPRLMEHLGREAPGVMIRALQLAHSAYRGLLESGQADLALGYLPAPRLGFRQQLLWRHDYVCLARTGHPRIGRKLGLEQYLECSHVWAAAQGPQGDPVERVLARRGLRRRIALEVPGYLVLPRIVAQTDLIATVSQSLVVRGGLEDRVRVLDLPFRVPATEVRQFWHQRFHQDAGNRWLRGLIAQIFAQSPG